jgi:hypothetical protein
MFYKKSEPHKASVTGDTSSPTFTAVHQTTLIEFAEANDITGWFFKSASTGTYQEIARITRTAMTIGSKFATSLSSGTMFSHGSMSDAMGYNGSYGTYIGSPVGGTYYLYANGSFFDNGTIRTLMHSGNFTSFINAPNAVGNGSGYYNVQNWLQVNGSHGIFWPGHYGFHIRPNITASHTQMEIIGSKNGYGGIYDNFSAVNGFMYDSGGNGGVYREANGRWYWYYHLGNNSMGIGSSTNSASYVLYASGSIFATGDIVAYSDIRKKTNIVIIDKALETVTKLRGVFYDKIGEEGKGRQLGVIAQEVNEILPEAVTHATDIDEYGVKYGNMVGLLIEAVKELSSENRELKARLDLIESKLKD